MGRALRELIQKEEQRERQEEQRRQRLEAAFDTVWRLPRQERDTVVAWLVKAVEKGVRPSKTPTKEKRQKSFVDLAEMAVLEAPGGLRSQEVASAIGQDAKGVTVTLRQAAKRGSISRDGDRWLPRKGGEPLDSVPVQRVKVKSVADFVLEVLAERAPLTSDALFQEIRKARDIQKGSVGVAVSRLVRDGALVQVGTGPNNAGLYALKNGGGQPPNAT